MRPPAKKITIYNHKGGVGKTTLTVNVAAALAAEGMRVLLVDSDPQCNLTSYLVPDNVVDDLLDTSETSHGRTIWSALKPICDGDGQGRVVKLLEMPGQPRAFLLPGDIQLSRFELALNDAWTDCFKRRVPGFRTTTAISELVESLCKVHRFDYVFYDAGPNIGPLNRVLLLDSDYFIIPSVCDFFSVRALITLGQTLKDWITDWETIATLAPSKVKLLKGQPQYLGYIPQRFRTYGGEMASTPATYASLFERHIYRDVVSVLKHVVTPLRRTGKVGHKLGEVRDYGPLVQQSQAKGVPMFLVNTGDKHKRRNAITDFRQIAKRILTLTR
ncbi:MAG TPA: AAA family ATPase [Pirellulales bacterium]|jgi:cellulose biosynthesis protein BcsQ|nr:AAA family ATPase [Pirellulales bacterium]